MSITDETGKININSLSASDGPPVRQRVDQTLRLVDLLNSQHGEDSPVSYSLIPAIIDWVDPDDDVTYLSFVTRENTGAENDYYQNSAELQNVDKDPASDRVRFRLLIALVVN